MRGGTFPMASYPGDKAIRNKVRQTATQGAIKGGFITASVVETKNSMPLVSGSRKRVGVRSSSFPPLWTTVRHSPVESCRRYIHISMEKVSRASE